jgi:hypothetical protein
VRPKQLKDHAPGANYLVGLDLRREMKMLFNTMVAYLSFLCRIFDVTPDHLGRCRRGNLPPPQGASVPVRWV